MDTGATWLIKILMTAVLAFCIIQIAGVLHNQKIWVVVILAVSFVMSTVIVDRLKKRFSKSKGQTENASEGAP